MEMKVGAVDVSVDEIVEGEKVERKQKKTQCGKMGNGRKEER